MIRKASQEDAPAIWNFLDPRRATSMFLSGNLKDHGINTHGHPKSNTVWLGFDGENLGAVFGLTEFGYLVFEAPEFHAGWASSLCHEMAGRRIRGMNGVWSQFCNIREALGLCDASGPFDVRQPHYHLALNNLNVPSGNAHLRSIENRDLSFLVDWRFASNVEVMSVPDTQDSRDMAERHAHEMLQNGRGRLLIADGQPVAMTAFNSVSGSCVQVGAVYTPPELRGQGFARRAVALHLREAHPNGIDEAILFAANRTAAKAYEAIGFEQIGEYGIVDFAEPQTVSLLSKVTA